MIALLTAGSAILLISCGGKTQQEQEENNEKMMTEQSDSLVRILSVQGKTSYRFETPLMERYSLAKEPYMEFRKGVKVEKLDTLGAVQSSLVSDYAIYFENQQLWEAKGNVVAVNAEGHMLETQQLFWNQRIKKIYSNIDSRMHQGNDVLVGTSFESDEDFVEWEIRSPIGKVGVSTEPNRDTTAVDSVPEPVRQTVPATGAPREEAAIGQPQLRRQTAGGTEQMQLSGDKRMTGDLKLEQATDSKISAEPASR